MQSFEKFLSTPIAHRGLHDDKFEENSLSAFRAAVENGFAIETDVHLLTDGVVAVHHDKSLKRTCGKDIDIETLSSADLKDYPMTLGGEIIPTLPQMLELVAGQVPILIELKTLCGYKNNDLARAVLRDLASYPYKDVIALQSFDFFAVKWLRKNQNEYPYGQLASGVGEIGKTPKLLNDFMGNLHCCKISKPMFIAYDVRNTPSKYMQAYKDKGTPIINWTINSKEKVDTAKRYADNLIFENIPIEWVK